MPNEQQLGLDGQWVVALTFRVSEGRRNPHKRCWRTRGKVQIRYGSSEVSFSTLMWETFWPLQELARRNLRGITVSMEQVVSEILFDARADVYV